MSLINQVLSDLDKRGAGGLSSDSAIRPVLSQSNSYKVALPVTIVLALLIFAAAGLWWGRLQQKSAAPEHKQSLSVEQSTVQPVAAPQAPVQAASHPDSIVLQLGNAPAMHLSSELSALPLPSVSPKKPVRVVVPVMAESISAPDNAVPHPIIPEEQKEMPVVAKAQDRSQVAAISAPVVVPQGRVDKQVKPLSVQQQADNEFRKANILMQQGRIDGAIAGYEAALQLDADHDAARQAMVGLLLESKRNTDAEGALQAGLNHNPKHSGFAMLLARLQVERGILPQALETLQKTLPYAEQQADYQAFVAAVHQRMGQHKDAVEHYQIALQSSPDSGIWLMGLGISLKVLQRKDEARVAFKHALGSHTLDTGLQAFVTQQLKEL